MFNLSEELKKLPEKPGVYLMHDKNDAIIYIGKAISLKNRVRQYFQKRDRSPKIEKMISQIARFEYIITDSEVEALVLENNLIKEHRPRYNTMLKDDKTYPFVKATVYEDYPRLIYSRQQKRDKCKYYGPYTSATAAREVLDLVHKICKIRTCNRVLPRDMGKERPCLNYHIKQCDAPCQGLISSEEYKKRFRKAQKFLSGDMSSIEEMLREKMSKACETYAFEEAATYRDLLESVEKLSVKQKVTDFDGTDRDIIAMAVQGDDAVVQVFFVREGRLIGRDHFHLTGTMNDNKENILQAFLKQFYAGTPFIPREVVVEYNIEDFLLIEKWLSQRRGGKVSLIVPVKGQKEKFVELAKKNAELVLHQDMGKLKREEERTHGAMMQITEWLGLSDICRIESYDISNIGGFQSVGSMVVYEDGRPKRSDYRKFRIKTVTGPDDYASMEEVLGRRFRHGIKDKENNVRNFSRFPDLIMMDGGQGQVHIAEKVLRELELDIPVCGMVKDDKHRTRALYFRDREIRVPTDSEGFHLMTRIQDEVHRFAIEYHRSLRSKTQVKSVLDDIPGVGARRRRTLMRTFETIENIKNASVDDIKDLEGMNTKVAQNIYDFFHKET